MYFFKVPTIILIIFWKKCIYYCSAQDGGVFYGVVITSRCTVSSKRVPITRENSASFDGIQRMCRRAAAKKLFHVLYHWMPPQQ